jgi:hypothetical protein
MRAENLAQCLVHDVRDRMMPDGACTQLKVDLCCDDVTDRQLTGLHQAVVAELEQNASQWFARLGEDTVRLTIVDAPDGFKPISADVVAVKWPQPPSFVVGTERAATTMLKKGCVTAASCQSKKM